MNHELTPLVETPLLHLRLILEVAGRGQDHRGKEGEEGVLELHVCGLFVRCWKDFAVMCLNCR